MNKYNSPGASWNIESQGDEHKLKYGRCKLLVDSPYFGYNTKSEAIDGVKATISKAQENGKSIELDKATKLIEKNGGFFWLSELGKNVIGTYIRRLSDKQDLPIDGIILTLEDYRNIKE